jgi:hypothetical protein
MATFSFDVKFSTTTQEYETPEGYFVELQGDRGEPSHEEIDCVMASTVPELARISEGHSSASRPIEIRGEKADLAALKSTHYVWRIERRDGAPMMPPEVQIALFSFSMRRWEEAREREPVVSMPLSVLKRLLMADEPHRQDLIAVLTDMPPGGQLVDIEDGEVAARLAALGVLAATDVPGFYSLSDIELK